jgi:predicted transglutaminase-like cysteine proteinase
LSIRSDMAEIHTELVRKFVYKTDLELFGKADRWGFPIEVNGVALGDCDDFAYHVYTRLREKGYEARLVLCLTEKSESHLICECEGWVSDNRFRDLKTAEGLVEYGYMLLCFNDPEGDGDWILFTGFNG